MNLLSISLLKSLIIKFKIWANFFLGTYFKYVSLLAI